MPFKPVDTDIVVSVGPLVDDTDFKTLEAAVAHDASGMSIDLFKEGANGVAKVDIAPTTGGANDWTHKGNGVYELELSAAQNDTEGTLWVVGVCDGVLPFESPRYAVVPAPVYNALVAGTDRLEVDAAEIGGSAIEHTAGFLKVKDASGNNVAPASDSASALTKLEALVGLPVLATTAVTPADLDIVYTRGDTAAIAFNLARDISGASLKFTVKRRHTDPQAAALIAKSSAVLGEITITDAEAGLFAVSPDAADTASLLPDGRPAVFVYDVEMTLGGAIETVAAGAFTLRPDVTTAS